MDARYPSHGGGGGGGGCISRYGMAVGGGGCVARYVGGGCGFYDISMVDRLMLKFRPIAPKPVGSGSGSSSGSGDSTAENGGSKSGRSKRKYVRVKGNQRNKDDKKRKMSTSSLTFHPSDVVPGGGDEVVTLSLMPETPDRKEEESAKCSSSENFNTKVSKPSSPIWSSFKKTARDGVDCRRPGQRQKTVSFVTVESVTETWVEGGWVKNMEMDTCPGFITDGGDRVVWMNKAYREMAGGEEVVVVVVRKEGVCYPAAFTCNVRVTCGSGSQTVPCDAWRMNGGGYAWRLDVKAALSLGR